MSGFEGRAEIRIKQGISNWKPCLLVPQSLVGKFVIIRVPGVRVPPPLSRAAKMIYGVISAFKAEAEMSPMDLLFSV